MNWGILVKCKFEFRYSDFGFLVKLAQRLLMIF